MGMSIGIQYYRSTRPLKYKRVAGRMCYCLRGIARSLCITMAVKLVKRCNYMDNGVSEDCLLQAYEELSKYLRERVGVEPCPQTWQ